MVLRYSLLRLSSRSGQPLRLKLDPFSLSHEPCQTERCEENLPVSLPLLLQLHVGASNGDANLYLFLGVMLQFTGVEEASTIGRDACNATPLISYGGWMQARRLTAAAVGP
jgi:hypothetical protein